MKILAAAIVAFCVLTVPTAPVAAQFELVEELRLSRPATPPGEPFASFRSVAFDGEDYWVGRFDRSVLRYDAMFNLIEEFDIPINFGNLRSVEVDRESGNLLVLINSSRILHEFTPDLDPVQTYSVIQENLSATSGLVLDPVTNTSWTSGVFTGVVTQYSREGDELSSFQTVDFDFFNSCLLYTSPSPRDS